MPNHIANHLILRGDESQINAFYKKIEIEFTFELFIPTPKSINDASIRQWSLVNWGTQWDCYYVEVVANLIKFSTAWNPPTNFLVGMSKQYPKVQFINEWMEQSTESAGITVVQNGVIISECKEDNLAWLNGQSGVIHQLNVKYDPQGYREYMESILEDNENLAGYLSSMQIS